jgi:hypothetical protein
VSAISWFIPNGTEARPACLWPRPRGTEAVAAALARQAVEHGERVQRRRVQRAEQRCDSSPPELRIRAWEQLHGLCLPRDPMHPVLDIVAIATRLTLSQVQAEQSARQRGARAPSVARDVVPGA